MRVCLVTAPTATDFEDVEEALSPQARATAAAPQLGILSLAAVLEQHGHQPLIVDANRLFYDHLAETGAARLDHFPEWAAPHLAACDADLYGFSSICSSYPLSIRLARSLKSLCPDTPIVFGGPQASVVDVATLNAFPFIDFILRGESEHSLPAFLSQLSGPRAFDRVPGLTFRGPFLTQRTPNGPVIEDLDSLPIPAYHLTGELQGAAEASLELGRGCPFACTFCSTNDFFRRRFRLKSPSRIIAEMRAIQAAYGIRQFDLVHDMFTVDRRRVVEFCQAMLEAGDGFQWACSARTDCIDDELLALMAAASCRGVFYGVETGSERMQRIIDKRLDPRQSERMIDAAEKHGIRSTVSLITGFPEETPDDLRDTIRLFLSSVRHPRSSPQLNLLAPLAETPLLTKYRGEMILEDLCSDMSHQGRSQNDLDRELIRSYPEIFPNFYLLPTPHLDRAVLLELREFLQMATARFRWLLAAVEQAAPDFYTLFLAWRAHREQIRPCSTGGDLRAYYRQEDFRTDYVGFLEHEPSLRRGGPLDPLLAYSRQLVDSLAADISRTARPATGDLQWDDLPARLARVHVVSLTCDLRAAVAALQSSDTGNLPASPKSYATRSISGDIARVHEISELNAHLLRLCDGRHSIADILPALDLPVEGQFQPWFCLELLRELRRQNWIEIYRPSTPAYSEASAAASAANQSPIHAL